MPRDAVVIASGGRRPRRHRLAASLVALAALLAPLAGIPVAAIDPLEPLYPTIYDVLALANRTQLSWTLRPVGTMAEFHAELGSDATVHALYSEGTSTIYGHLTDTGLRPLRRSHDEIPLDLAVESTVHAALKPGETRVRSPDVVHVLTQAGTLHDASPYALFHAQGSDGAWAGSPLHEHFGSGWGVGAKGSIVLGPDLRVLETRYGQVIGHHLKSCPIREDSEPMEVRTRETATTWACATRSTSPDENLQDQWSTRRLFGIPAEALVAAGSSTGFAVASRVGPVVEMTGWGSALDEGGSGWAALHYPFGRFGSAGNAVVSHALDVGPARDGVALALAHEDGSVVVASCTWTPMTCRTQEVRFTGGVEACRAPAARVALGLSGAPDRVARPWLALSARESDGDKVCLAFDGGGGQWRVTHLPVPAACNPGGGPVRVSDLRVSLGPHRDFVPLVTFRTGATWCVATPGASLPPARAPDVDARMSTWLFHDDFEPGPDADWAYQIAVDTQPMDPEWALAGGARVAQGPARSGVHALVLPESALDARATSPRIRIPIEGAHLTFSHLPPSKSHVPLHVHVRYTDPARYLTPEQESWIGTIEPPGTGASTWAAATFDLSAFAGREIRLVLGRDATTCEGWSACSGDDWRVDDVRVALAQG